MRSCIEYELQFLRSNIFERCIQCGRQNFKIWNGESPYLLFYYVKFKRKLRYILYQNINRIIYCKHKSSWHNAVVPKKLSIELFFVECKVTIPMVHVFCFINFYSMSEAQNKETCVHQYIQCYLWGSGDSWWGGVLALPPPESGEWLLM